MAASAAAAPAPPDAVGRTGAAWRRRQQKLRSLHRHFQLTMKMATAAAVHHTHERAPGTRAHLTDEPAGRRPAVLAAEGEHPSYQELHLLRQQLVALQRQVADLQHLAQPDFNPGTLASPCSPASPCTPKPGLKRVESPLTSWYDEADPPGTKTQQPRVPAPAALASPCTPPSSAPPSLRVQGMPDSPGGSSRTCLRPVRTRLRQQEQQQLHEKMVSSEQDQIPLSVSARTQIYEKMVAPEQAPLLRGAPEPPLDAARGAPEPPHDVVRGAPHSGPHSTPQGAARGAVRGAAAGPNVYGPAFYHLWDSWDPSKHSMDEHILKNGSPSDRRALRNKR